MKQIYLWPICCVAVWVALIILAQVSLRLTGFWVILAVIVAMPFGIFIGAGIAAVVSAYIESWFTED